MFGYSRIALNTAIRSSTTKNEFKGAFYEIREVKFERKDGSKESREIEITYYIWYRLAE